MRIRSIITICLITVVAGGGFWFAYRALFTTGKAILFKTQKPEKRDIHKVVHAEGSLEAHETSKLGILINAKVEKIYVKEGQVITKGTLLADLSNIVGGDTEVRRTEAELEQAKASFEYISINYKREKALYDIGQRSQDAWDKDQETYRKAKAEVRLRQASHDKELFLFEQTRMYAPHDGTVIAVGVEAGETVSQFSSTPQVLFKIARDLKKMKATLFIDENKIGDVRVGMMTEISVDTYPYKEPWKGAFDTIGASPFFSPQQQQGQTAAVVYKAEVLIDNAEGLLRPGMTVHAKATIAQADQALAVPGLVFQINGKVLEGAAKVMGYDFKPLLPEKKKALTRLSKTLWVVEGKSLIERAVEIGITDNAYFQILSGLQETDDVIADDMTESEELKKIAKQIAGS